MIDHTTNIIERTSKLCHIESETGNQAGSIAMALELRSQIPTQAQLRTMPSSSPDIGDDIIITLQGTGEGGALLLGHYDTVARIAGTPIWEQDDDTLFGLGTYDMKGGLAMALELVSTWAQTPEQFSILYLLILADEERRDCPPRYRLSPWAGCGGLLSFEGGESDTLQSVVHGRYGAGIMTSTVMAPNIRAELPLRGPSAMQGIGELLATQEEIAQQAFPHVQLVPTHIQTNSTINVLPDQIQSMSLLRFRNSELLETTLQLLPTDLAGCKLQHEFDIRFPSLDTTMEGTAIIERAACIFPDLKVTHRTGSSDACWFSNSFPVIFDGLGPGGSGEHSKDEHILIETIQPQYELADYLLEEVVSLLDGRARPLPFIPL